jgi:hypothetical protein
MTAAVLGIALLVATGRAAPSQESPRPTAPSILVDYNLPVHAGPVFDEFKRPWTSTPVQGTARRHSKADRIIAAAAGGALGFVLGGTIGAYIAGDPNNPDDDISPLRGVMIGAPIGAVAGALLGYYTTR